MRDRRPSARARGLLALNLAFALMIAPLAWAEGETSAPLRTGPAFREVLRSTVNVVRPHTPTRDVFNRLASLYEISVLLDRRVDPDRVIDVQLSRLTLLNGLKFIASQFEADAAAIGSTVVIGPSAKLDRMRTDIARQTKVLESPSDEATLRRTFKLLQRRTIRWDDLATPREILDLVAAEFDVQILNAEVIPHDLWAGGVMSDVHAAEALVIVAGQFDLTFVWNDQFTEVRLEPSPPRLTIERLHSGSSDRIDELLEAADEFTETTMERSGRQLRVVATVGEHERIAALLKGDDASGDASVPESAPLDRRTFTITTRPVPALTVLRHLESQDVIVEYDSRQLEEAGVDLLQKVTLSLTEASADEFFHALCDPLGLTFELEGKTVRISPAP